MFLNAFMDKSFDYGVLVRGPVALGALEVNMTCVFVYIYTIHII
jgi:hypothetical protein